MLWGFFLKIVVADKLSLTVNQVYGQVGSYHGLPLIIATYFFAFQIFCDFAGYSFIAIGAAKSMGIDLMQNFRRPYFSKSISEFWTRWHISLSSWFRDYLYIPLGGNRVSKARWIINIFIVFLMSGLWHGAGWTYLIWGGLNGFYLIFSNLTAAIRKNIIRKIILIKNHQKIFHIMQIIITFHLVLIAWIFFRAKTLADAIYIFKHILPIDNYNFDKMDIPLGFFGFTLLIFFIFCMETGNYIQEKIGANKFLAAKSVFFRWGIYLFLLLSILLFGEFGHYNFIYFQF
jgi:D-alanyl-lipoteichoic acid acyltransferase DltB (MBOAT superfamily)